MKLALASARRNLTPIHFDAPVRRALAALVVACVVISPTAPANAQIPHVSAASAVVVDGWTGAVLYAKNPDSARAPASTTKIMTALVVLESRIPMNRVVTVSSLAASYGGSTAGLYAGERMTVWDLMHGMLLPSGNDAAVALAEATTGSLSAFVSAMNRLAHQLGLWHTHFLTPTGLDVVGQQTTARELARLSLYVMQRPRFLRIVRTHSWTVRDAYGRVIHYWTNLNRLLWTLPGADGVKTGTTPLAGACLVSSDRIHGRWVLAVNLGSTVAARFSDGSTLLNLGLSRASTAPSAR